jgi:hypothetical protein
MGRAETLPQTSRNRELHYPLMNPSRPRTTSPTMRRWVRKCTWHRPSLGMSRSSPMSTTSGEDLKRRPTNSYRFGCPIKPWAVIPSNRMEWTRSCYHTSSSHPPHRFGRSVCSFVAFLSLGQVSLSHVCYYGFLSHYAPYPCMLVFFTPRWMLNRVPLPLLGSSLVNLPTRRVCSTTTLVHAHTCTYPFPSFCYTQLTHAGGVPNQVASSPPSAAFL